VAIYWLLFIEDGQIAAQFKELLEDCFSDLDFLRAAFRRVAKSSQKLQMAFFSAIRDESDPPNVSPNNPEYVSKKPSDGQPLEFRQAPLLNARFS